MASRDESPAKRSDHLRTWSRSDGFLASKVVRPTSRFLQFEAAGGIVLLGATAIALILANSPVADSYFRFWSTDLSVTFGDHSISHDLTHWVNDALMVLFFFVVGLEIKQELVIGRLRRMSDAALPMVAAIGGMVVPAALYSIINFGGSGARGWGIPMATDIAFAVGVIALVGNRVPGELKVMLLALAIVDDIGAIAVIAIFYTDQIEGRWLLLAVVGVGITAAMQRARIWYVPLYVVVGAAVWFATLMSGVHATVAGVTLGLLTPAIPLAGRSANAVETGESPLREGTGAHRMRTASFELRESVSVAERLQELLHPWTSFVIIPLFALANAGIVVSGDVLSRAATSRITLGIVVGLVAGKLVGITAATSLMLKLGLARLPDGLTLRHVAGMAMVAGIGFTVSIFISGLAFDDPLLDAEAKIGILSASCLAAVLGLLWLRMMPPRRRTDGH